MPMAQQNRFVFFLLVVLVVAVVFVVLVVFVVVAVVSSSRQRWLRLDLLPTAFLLLRSLLMAAATFFVVVSSRSFDFGVFEGQLELPVLISVFGFPFLFLLEKVLMRFDGGPWIFLEIR